MYSKFFSVDKSDLGKGFLTAAFAGVIIVVANLVRVDGFSVFHVNWLQLLDNCLSAGVAAGMGYLIKNFFTDSEGTFLGKADRE